MALSLGARTTLVAGLLVALIFLFLGVRELRSAPRLANKPSQSTAASATPAASVVLFAVATRAIDTGETITAAMVRNAAADPGRFPNIATPPEVVGKVATQPIPAGAMIARTSVDLTTKLAVRVPMGMRAMSIDTTAEIAVAGLVRPGDRVDVQVVYPGADAINGTRGDGESRAQALLQMVQVLAVGDLIVGTPAASGAQGAMSSAPPPARTVTLALSPDQVSSLSLAKATGSLYLSLRNPSDNQQVAVASVQSSVPARRAAAQPIAAPIVLPRPAARSAPASIDLVVGERHEVIYPGSSKP
ncbi:MAG: Flp pilus assembly protein CpaB [Sphingobium sp.]|nr:Flp pilus assembly protein CpaB [Sphingobium sp.]